MKKIVIALGGNAIKQWDQKGTAGEQYENVKTSCAHIVRIVQRGYRVVITHGNGPQVGSLLIQQEEGAHAVPAQPLSICGAMSQGQIGFMIQQALLNELKDNRLSRDVVTLVTQVMVDRQDPGFQNPTKPIGPFYSKAQKEKMEKNGGMVFKAVRNQDGERYRRVVASPDPLRILEGRMIKDLFDRGVIVIASGGGGIPVIMDEQGHVSGAEAVIDKDLAGEKLAEAVGADLFLILTDVEKVYLHYGTKRQVGLGKVSLDKAQQYLKNNQFPPGSMGPKVEACIRFIKYGGEKAIITSLDRAVDALDGKTGTHILPDQKRGPTTWS
ncbi:MAG: carbamate kinase [Syntrophaceae bacterium]|nr:carbamate kinase [Syntrophaceae bacterium]